MGEVLRKGHLCTLVYERRECSTDSGMVLKRCIPDEGVSLFEICATYAKQIPPTKYYRLGTSAKDAKERFNNKMWWMRVTSIRLIPPGEEAGFILTDLNIMPM